MSITSPTAAEIKAFRAEMGMSQAALAAAVGVSSRTVEDWEADRRKPLAYLSLAFDRLRDLAAKPAAKADAEVEAPRAKPAAKAPRVVAQVGGAAGPARAPDLHYGPVDRKPGDLMKKPKAAKN